MSGYDIIGDVHGCATELVDLLVLMGYEDRAGTGAYEHPERQAVFVGDLVDRGPEQPRVLQIVKTMVEAGSAQIVMGNHEFNAVAYATEHPDRPGEYLRKHTEKNNRQHAEFLRQVTGEGRAEYLRWFMTIPLWLDLGDIRIIHACWHEPSMQIVSDALGSDRFTTTGQLVDASTKGHPLYEAVEVLLKGPEVSLTAYGQAPYSDKDGTVRGNARVAWWREGATTLRELAVMDGNFVTADGDPYPDLPDLTLDGSAGSYGYQGAVPVFYGHYWRRAPADYGQDWTAHTACVDFSAVKTGVLAAYRWSGETQIQADHYVGLT